MWWLALLFTLIASPVFSESYTAVFHDPLKRPASVVSIPFTSPVENPVVTRGTPLSTSNHSALVFAGAVNAPPLGPTPEPIGSLILSNGETLLGTEIDGVGLTIFDSSGQQVDLTINIHTTPNALDPLVSADSLALANPGFCPSPSTCSPNGLTPDLRAFENNAVSAGLYATQGSIILAGIGPVLDPRTGFRTGSINPFDVVPLANTANVANLIDARGNVFPNVPEPSAWLLVASGLPVLWAVKRNLNAVH